MLKPLNERVVLKMVKEEEKTVGGLVLPSSAQEKSQIAEVVAIHDEEKAEIKIGDKVLYEKFAGVDVKYEGEEYIVIKAKDIVAVVE